MNCPFCSKELKIITVKKSRGAINGMMVFAVGVIVTVVIPVIGWVIGPLICISVIFDDGETSKSFFCKKCNTKIGPADAK